MKKVLGWLFFVLLVFGLWACAYLSWQTAISEPRQARRTDLPSSWRVIVEDARMVDEERVSTLVDKYRSFGATVPHTLACNGLDERSARHLTYKTGLIICGPAEGGGIAGR